MVDQIGRQPNRSTQALCPVTSSWMTKRELLRSQEQDQRHGQQEEHSQSRSSNWGARASAVMATVSSFVRAEGRLPTLVWPRRHHDAVHPRRSTPYHHISTRVETRFAQSDGTMGYRTVGWSIGKKRTPHNQRIEGCNPRWALESVALVFPPDENGEQAVAARPRSRVWG